MAIHTTSTAVAKIDGTTGDDNLNGTAADEQLYGQAGNDTLSGGGGKDSLYGGPGDDYLYSIAPYNTAARAAQRDNAGDLLDGGDGDDLLAGAEGDDTLDGGSGHNFLLGGDGNDTYVIRSVYDWVYDSAGTDSGIINVNWYKTNPQVEKWTWAAGIQKLPYWIDALTYVNAQALDGALGPAKTIGYCFALWPATFFSADDKKGFTPFTASQISYAKQLFAYIEAVLDVHFVETRDPDTPCTMVLGNNSQATSSGYAIPMSFSSGSVVMIDSDMRMLFPDRDHGQTFLSVLVHEVGHALGLKHPFAHADAGGNMSEGPYLPASEDNTDVTVMSYSDGAGGTQTKYSPLDIAALQYLYGIAPSAQAGDSRYVLSADCSWMIADGAGTDTIDGSQLSQALSLYLEPGYWGHVGAKADTISAPGQVTVNFGTVIENALGGAGADLIVGNDVANDITGGAGNDVLEGAGGNDRLRGGAGDDRLEGGAGADTAVYSGRRATFSVTHTSDGWIVDDSTGTEGRDSLSGVERLAFADGALALDVDGTAAKAYRVYAAAFDRTPDLAGLGFWIDRMDKGTSLTDVATGFTQSAEFTAMYGANPSAQTFISKLYQNILHRTPDQGGLDFWVNAMHKGASEGVVLASFSESAENQAQVIGSIAHGIAYVAFA